MSSSTGPPPPTGIPPSTYPPPFPEQTAFVDWSTAGTVPILLPEAIAKDEKGRIPDAWITTLYLNHDKKFSADDIYTILVNKGLMRYPFTKGWEGFYNRLEFDAIMTILTTYQTDYSPKTLGRLLAQGRQDMAALYHCMYIGADHLKGVDVTVDENHVSQPLRVDADGNNIHGNPVHQAAWNTVYPNHPLPKHRGESLPIEQDVSMAGAP